MVYSHPLYGRAPTALLTGRKQFPFRETIKIKLSVNSPKVTACNLITPEMRAVNPVKCHPPTLGSVLPPTDLAVRILQRRISSPHLDVFLVAIAAHLAMESQSRCSYLSQMQHSNMYQLASSHPLPTDTDTLLCSHQLQISSAFTPHPGLPMVFLGRTQWNCTTDKFITMTFSVTKTHLPFGQCNVGAKDKF